MLQQWDTYLAETGLLMLQDIYHAYYGICRVNFDVLDVFHPIATAKKLMNYSRALSAIAIHASACGQTQRAIVQAIAVPHLLMHHPQALWTVPIPHHRVPSRKVTVGHQLHPP